MARHPGKNYVWCVCKIMCGVYAVLCGVYAVLYCVYAVLWCVYAVLCCVYAVFVVCVCSFCGVCMQFLWCVFAHLCRVCMQFLIVLTLTFVKTSHLCGIWVCAGKHTGPMPRDGRT